MMSAIKVEGVTQVYRVGFWMHKFEVLHRVNFEVPTGSIFGFVGANGAGKTSLIQLIVGIRRPTEGNVLINGLPSYQRQAKLKIGYLPERPYFYSHLTGAQFLQHMGTLSQMDQKFLKSRIPEVLNRVGIFHAADLELRKYSKGMLQRLGIGQAILHDPEVLILDEPMSGLDPVGRKEIRDLMLSLNASGKTVFFSTHIISDVEAICSQIAVIQKGKLLGCGEIKNFFNEEVSIEVVFSGVPVSDLNLSFPIDQKYVKKNNEILVNLKTQKEVDSLIGEIVKRHGHIVKVGMKLPSLEKIFGYEES